MIKKNTTVENPVKTTKSSYFVILINQYNWLRKESYESNRSMSAIVRDAIDFYIKNRTPSEVVMPRE